MKPDPISRWLHHRSQGHGPVILMYHSVQPGAARPDWPWAVSMAQFEAQLDFLAGEGWRAITVAELAAAPALAGNRTVAITFDDGYSDNFPAFEALARRNMRASWFIVTGSVGRRAAWGKDGNPSATLLGAAQLREMRSAGMEIGSHTVDHVRLPTLDSDAQARQLVVSKRSLEQLLGDNVRSFAYPYGAWDEKAEEEVSAAGYEFACTTRAGWALRDEHPLRLRRLTIWNTDSLGSFARKLVFADNDASWPSVGKYWAGRLLSRLA